MNIILFLSVSCGKGERRKGMGDVHERMWEAHFAAVDDAIANAFDEGQDVVVLWVKDDFLERGLEGM
jgi:hypothetical protein